VDAAVDGPRATTREWAGLILLALPCLLVSFDSQALNLAIPKLTVALHPSATELLWIVDSYVFFGAGSLITMGVLGDRVGRRRMLFIGGAVFALASLGAAYSPSPGVLIAARMVMGMAGSALMPSTLSLIREMFANRRQRTIALSAWTASFSLGGLLAPVYGLKRIAQTGLDPLSIAAIVVGALSPSTSRWSGRPAAAGRRRVRRHDRQRVGACPHAPRRQRPLPDDGRRARLH
jgi:MFS family permease